MKNRELILEKNKILSEKLRESRLILRDLYNIYSDDLVSNNIILENIMIASKSIEFASSILEEYRFRKYLREFIKELEEYVK